MIKTPKFWYKPKGLFSTLLLPAAWLYQIGHTVAQATKAKPHKASIPVICVGNAISGGGGKTPTSIALMKAISENGLYKNPYFLTRGYGRKSNKVYLVDPKTDISTTVGDEALLLARHAPTIVSANRAEGAKLAEQKGADLIIMDDGLFHQSLHKDIQILVIDRQIDFGNNRTLPAGPLRAPLSKILPVIDAVITIGRPFAAADCPVFESTLISTQKPDTNKNYIAFAGLAIPDKFKNTLLDLGYKITKWFPFPDHHPYSENDIKEISKHKGQLITTEKDFVRLPKDFQQKVEILSIKIEIKETNTLFNFIQKILNPT